MTWMESSQKLLHKYWRKINFWSTSLLWNSHERVRQSLRRVDPLGVEARCRCVLHRQSYYVPSSNALWHIDG